MINPEIRDQAYQFFIEEVPELLQIIEGGLLTLKEEHSNATVHEIMRAAHSIKGGAASLEFNTIKTLAHRLEDFFKALYNDTVEIDTELESLFLQGYDALRDPLIEQIETGFHNEEQAIAKAEPIWAKIEERLGDSLAQADQYIPSSADLGVDIVASLFEVDVTQGLEHLATVSAHPDNYDLLQELATQLDIFSGFAEMLNLPGFGEIVQATHQALAKSPHEARDILQLALVDLMQSREMVLEQGDRTSGGSPSAALLAFSQGGDSEVASEAFLGQENADWENASALSFDTLFEETVEEEEIGWIQAEVEDSASVSEVFGNFHDDQVLWNEEQELAKSEIEAETEESITLSPSLDDVFGEVIDFNLDSEEANSVESVSQTDESPEMVFQTPDINDIFDNVPDDNHEAEIAQTPSLDNIFGDVPDANHEAEIAQAPSLDEIFGHVPDADTKDTSNSQAVEEENERYALETVFGVVEDSSELTPITPEAATEIEADTDLDAEIKAVEASFEQLLPVEQLSIHQQPSNPQPITPPVILPHPTKSQKSPTTEQHHQSNKTAKSPSSASNLSVRVDFERLERMNNLVGELAINRNSLSLQNDQMQSSVKGLLNRFERFQLMTGKLREIADKLLISGEKQDSSRVNTQQTPDVSWLQTDFDSLEMDNYDSLYGLLQTLLEEMMQLEESVDDIVLFARTSNQTLEQQRQMLKNLRNELMWARMLPLSEVLNRFPRVLRDLSTQYHKPVRLKLVGTGVLVDKAALEKLYDPLLHLLRNAFDHGIESPEERRKRGKPEEGEIVIHAYHQGNQTILEIRDDGQGLNLEKIKQKALKNGLSTPEQLAVASPERLQNLIFEPGFSTAAQVSELSGRGVGLDVVRAQLQGLKGTVSIISKPGQGTTFMLRLPLTLTIAKLLVCLVDQDRGSSPTTIAFPSDSIEEIIVPQDRQLKTSGNQRFLQWQGQIIPIYPVKSLLNYQCAIPETFSTKVLEAVPNPDDWGLPLLILRRGQQLYALEVNRLMTEQELVIKPFGEAIAAPRYSYGCTILGDGTLIPVINGITLIEEFLEPGETSIQGEVIGEWMETGDNKAEISQTANQTSLILVVDDSAALRRTLALTLEKAGYRTVQARDGREALEQLQRSAGIAMVICDVEMPNMNGFEFLGQRRRDPEMMKVPVAMLTSRSSDKHRQLAMTLGASAYFTKPYIEQQFLISVENIIREHSSSAIAVRS